MDLVAGRASITVAWMQFVVDHGVWGGVFLWKLGSQTFFGENMTFVTKDVSGESRYMLSDCVFVAYKWAKGSKLGSIIHASCWGHPSRWLPVGFLLVWQNHYPDTSRSFGRGEACFFFGVKKTSTRKDWCTPYSERWRNDRHRHSQVSSVAIWGCKGRWISVFFLPNGLESSWCSFHENFKP